MRSLPKSACMWFGVLAAACAACWAEPRIEVQPARHDFGKVFQGATVEKRFMVRNAGDAPLKIERVRGGCALCATSMLQAKELQPGGTDVLKVAYYAKAKLGRHKTFLMVHSNDPKEPFKRIELAVTVVSPKGQPRIVCQPEKLDLGNVTAGRKRVARVSVSNTKDAKTALLIKATSSSAACRVEGVAPKRIDPGKIYALTVAITPRKPGPLAEHVEITTNDPVTPVVSIPIIGRAVADPAGVAKAGKGTAPPPARPREKPRPIPDGDAEAHISFPFDEALVRANVPVFGVGWAKEFKSYRLEFGEGRKPTKWILIQHSMQPQPSDPFAQGKLVWSKDWGFPKGNLGTWQTGLDEYDYGQKFKHNLRGEYTLRLAVRDKQDRIARHEIVVTVARALTNARGGYGESPDKVVRFKVPPNALDEAFKLVSILPTDKLPAPKRLVQLSHIYEFRPPGLELARPATLSFRFAPADLDKKRIGSRKITPNQVAIHAYDPVDQRWRPLLTKVDAQKGKATTSVRLTPRYLAYYALLADVIRPGRPRLARLPAFTQARLLTVKGTAEPDSRAIVTCTTKNGVRRFRAVCDATGSFSAQVHLSEGANTLTVYCVEKARNRSALTRPHQVLLGYRHPKRVREVRFVGAKEAASGSKLRVKLAAADKQPGRNTTLVHVSSTKTDPEGFTVEAVETGPRTEVYEAAFDVGRASDPANSTIGAQIDGEKIVAAWERDPKSRAKIAYRDRVPPSAPTLVRAPNAALCWNTFEADAAATLKQWRPLDGPAGAERSIESEDGNHFMHMCSRENRAGHLGVTAWTGACTLSAHPVVSFDFRASPGTEVDLLVNVAEPKLGWRGVALTDRKPYYARLGRAHGVRADGKWHRVTVNVRELVRARYPDATDGRITRVAFADWDGGDRLFGTKYHGQSASKGCTYDVDNFAITSFASASESVTFTWSSQDVSGISGWSYVLDRSPHTAPPKRDMGADAKKTYEGLAEGRWWFHVRARDRCGNWGPANHFLHVVDTEPPTASLASAADTAVQFKLGVSIKLSDAGSGVDPSSVVLTVDGRQYRTGEPALEYNATRGLLTWRPRLAKPYPFWFVLGAPVPVKLQSLHDYAGHGAAKLSSWRLDTASPVVVTNQEVAKHNGWCVAEPQVGLRGEQQNKYTLAWMRTLQGDRYAKRGCYIREIALLPKAEQQKEAGRSKAIPIRTAKSRPHFVAEVKVDRTVPHTRIETTTQPGKNGKPAETTIKLSHDEYAYRRGGLWGRYYRTPDFAGLICQRVDPSVYFFDDREAFTRPVRGAQSAVWQGGLYVREQEIAELELAIWRREPASGRALIDGEVVLELRPEEMAVAGYKKEKVLLTPGMHELRLEFREPDGRPWGFALFRWSKGKRGEDIRESLGPEELYYPSSVGTTYYRWNTGAWQTYERALTAPPGRNVLSFYTADAAGHREPVQRREFYSAPRVPAKGEK